MIVVGVRVTRISTDGCAVRMQFVVGLHSVPYLFNSNFYQLTLRASNDWVLFFFALISAPARVLHEPGEGRTRRRKHPRRVAVLCGCAVYLQYYCAAPCQTCYPQELSTVWRTYTHVIWRSRIEAHHGGNLRALQKNSCNYRLSRPLKPRVSS